MGEFWQTDARPGQARGRVTSCALGSTRRTGDNEGADVASRTARYRAAGLGVVLALTLASCTASPGAQVGGTSTASTTLTPSQSPATTTATPSVPRSPWLPNDPAFDSIAQLLDRRAQAIVDHDQAAFDATLDTSDQAFVAVQDTEFANLVKLGATDVGYTVQHVAYAPADVSTTDPLLRPNVIEHVTIPGIDRHPVGNSVNFTFVEHDGTWLLAAEQFITTGASTDPIIDYSHPSQSRPWAPGPIAVARNAHIVVVTDQAQASQGAGLVTADQARDRRRRRESSACTPRPACWSTPRPTPRTGSPGAPRAPTTRRSPSRSTRSTSRAAPPSSPDGASSSTRSRSTR